MTRSGTHKLVPEYSRAVSHLDKKLEGGVYFSPAIDNKVLIDGSFNVYEKGFSIKQIPSGKYWRWNQTNSRKEAQCKSFKVKVLKLIPRKRNLRSSIIPSLKLWQYEIVDNTTNKTYFALWCEKGLSEEQMEKELKTQKKCLDLEIWNELHFLSMFMSESDAALCWPTDKNYNILSY